jgi:Protein of unknown function (DUF2789)
MDTEFHRLCDLFAQLGLPHEPAAVDAFITRHRPLPAGMSVCDAPFWTPSQAEFLREQMRADADWALVVDSLALRLSA